MVGRWDASSGPVCLARDDLAAAVDAARDPSLSAPILKIGHVDPRFDGEPALGHVASLRLASGGTVLVGDFVGIPAWLDAVLVDSYPNRSIEAEYGLRSPSGITHRFAVTAVALLGVTPPAVTSLATLQHLFGNTPR